MWRDARQHTEEGLADEAFFLSGNECTSSLRSKSRKGTLSWTLPAESTAQTGVPLEFFKGAEPCYDK